MNTLHVLLSPLAAATCDAGFRNWLAHGDRLPSVTGARHAALRRVFRFAGTAMPVAALRHHACAADAGIGAWVAADPAYIRSEANGARLMGWPIDDLSADEAGQLARALRPLFGDAGTPLAVDSPSSWCVHLPGGTPPAEFTAPREARGADMLECLPAGAGGRSWRRLFTEAQVVLHAHPVNAARIAVGKVPVNAVWFWGAGALPAPVDTVLKAAMSDEATVRGLAKAAGLACAARTQVDAQDAQVFGASGDALLDLDGDAAAPALWLPRFRQWLRQRRFDAIELTFADGERHRVRRVHRWRFWRRA
jgi:hypothetical protein